MKKKLLLGLAAMLLSWTAWAALEGSNSESPFVVTLTENGNPDKEISGAIQYAGDKTQPGIKVEYKTPDSEESTTLTANDYTVSYTYKTHKEAEGEGTEVDAVRNAGHYTMTIKGKGTYYYAPAQTVEFDVEPKAVDEFLRLKAGLKTTYGTDIELDNLVDQTTTSFAFLAEGDEAENFIKCLEVDKSKLSENYPNVGTYGISVKDNGAKGNNYTYTAQSGMWVTFTIEKKDVTLAVEGKDYDGVEVTVSELEATINGLVDGDEEYVEIALSYTDEKVTKADAYELTVTASGDAADNYNIPKTVDYTIARKTLQIKAKDDADLSTTYTGAAIQGTDVTAQFDHTGDVTGEWDGLKLTLKWDGGTNVGEYAIKLYHDETTEVTDENKGTVLDNYTIDYTAAKYEITGKSIANFTVTPNNDKVIYQGKDYELVKDEEGKTGVVIVKDGETELTEGVDYQVKRQAKDAEGYTEAINAGSTFMVTIEGDGNYAGSATTTLTIQRAELTITAKNNSKVYGESDPESLIGEGEDAAYQVTGFVNGETAKSIELSMIRDAGENVGSYIVRPAYQGTTFWETAYATTLPNYTITGYSPNTDKFQITKKTLEYWVAEAKATYGDTPTFTVAVSEEEGTLAPNDKVEDIFTGNATPVIKVVDEEGAEITDVKNVGTYTLAVTNAEDIKDKAANYELNYVAEKNGSYTIEKATVTITAPSITIEFGEEITEDDLKEMAKWSSTDKDKHASITGAKYSDGTVLRNMFTLALGEGAQTGATGVYQDNEEEGTEDGIIVVLKKEDELTTTLQRTAYKNYEFKKVNGTLTIGLVQDLELDGSEEDLTEKLEAHNGATVTTISVTNLQNVRSPRILTAKQWYTLVLPFDVTPLDLVNAFKRYIIVNVPNLDNTNPDVISFKLTMDNVPANTLMAFKVDEDMEWGEDFTADFTGKTIVYDADAEPQKDNAGNNFIGVYAKKEITEANEWYLWTDGNPYDAAAAHRTIYPLNGYVEFKELTSNARILFEEADGSTTEIRAINAEKINVAEGWYTVGGVKLNAEPTEKGVYINNGKKVVIK